MITQTDTASRVMHNGGCGNLQGMETNPWRDRIRQEEELLEQLHDQTEAALRRRAAALQNGVDELGSVYAVAKDLEKSWTAVAKAIKKYTTE